MFEKVLIANRGEIAVRIFRACWDLGIHSVAVYSAADRNAPHVRIAHEAYEIGPAPANESYLRGDKLIEVAKSCGAKAIHPGYGFLAENADFAEAVTKAGLVFIGPPASAMRAMGDKVRARAVMQEAGVPIVPGTGAFTGSPEEAAAAAKDIGFPVMVKASAGGGGKGMRIVHDASDVANAVARARSEAKSSFGDDTVYLERFVERPRHIEVQVLFDGHGHGVHLGERECSIQRRHQKLVEETPSVIVNADDRARIGELALAAGRAVDYVGAGTVEFLRGDNGSYYFMEMNTRLQVEHPVTEQVYGIDIVEEQIRIAAGQKLSLQQEDVVPSGHSIECRITAEDPQRNFMPCPGRIDAVRIPGGPGVRDDSAVAPGYTIPVEYDPMVAKLITYGADREEAIQRMRRALDEYRLDGLTTIIPFLRRLMDHDAFVAGDLHTGFLDEYGTELKNGASPWLEDHVALAAAAIHAHRSREERTLARTGDEHRPEGQGRRSLWKDAGMRRSMRGGLR